jgi:hypothetical protein
LQNNGPAEVGELLAGLYRIAGFTGLTGSVFAILFILEIL